MHCKDVSIREVECELTKENIAALMDDWKAYTRTDDLVLSHQGTYAAVHIVKEEGHDLFRKVIEYEIISLPADTVYVERPDFDILNIPALAGLQDEFPGKTVIVKGLFSHINVVSGMEPVRLRVVETVPPFPSKLATLTKMALVSGFVNAPVIMDELSIDITELADDIDTEGVMFPCRVSGMTSDRKTYFLDEVPEVDCDVTLVGCKLSQRIFKENYGKDVPFINTCPLEHIPDDGRITLVKCCKVKNGHTVEGNVICVPWGATVPEIAEALNDVFGEKDE